MLNVKGYIGIFLFLLISSAIFAIPMINPKPQSIIIPNSLCLQPDKNTLFAGYSDGKIAKWNLATGVLIDLVNVPSHTSPVVSIAIAPNGLYLAAGHQDGTLRIWSINPIRVYGEVIRENNAIWACLFSGDSKYVFTGNADGRLRKWNVENKNLESVYTRHRRLINAATFSPNGRFLASGASDNTMLLWNVASGEIERDIEAHNDWITDLSFSPNGAFLISTSIDGHIKVWAVERGYQLRDIGPFESAVWSCEYLSEEKVLFGTASGNLSLWNIETAKELRTEKQAHDAAIRKIVYSAKTGQVYTSSNDGTVRIWDNENLNLIATLLLVRNGEWISYMPLGKYVASQNALIREDFYVKDGDQEFSFEQYRDFLQRAEFLPIGDIFGPEMKMLNTAITPRETVLKIEVADSGTVEKVTERGIEYPINDKKGMITLDFDIWDRESSTLVFEAQDAYGNVSQANFPISFEGFRFFLKEDYPPLQKNAMLTLVAIADDLFVVEWEGDNITIPKHLVTQTPYAPEISIEILEPVLPMNQTESSQINLKVIITDILGVTSGKINRWHEIAFKEPVKRYEIDQTIPLDLGENRITVTATNVEDITKETTVTITRIERVPPVILISPFPSRIFDSEYMMSLSVSDNYLVAYVSVNGIEYPVKERSKELLIPVPVSIGENRLIVEAFDTFSNVARTQVIFSGARKMYTASDGVKVVDKNGSLLRILMQGDEVTVIAQAPPKSTIELESGVAGNVDSANLQWDVIDLLPPNYFDVRAKLEKDRIVVSGYVYDDKDISNLIVGGQSVTPLTPVSINISGYPVRKTYYFSLSFKITMPNAQAFQDEIKPITLQVYDTMGRSRSLTVVPRVYP
jgi:hypothetical protein